jgi:tRNA threonylcarbamoyladenosine biosynthesis protein TsaB
MVALDARMNEVFTGLYTLNGRGVMSPVAEEQVCSPEDVQPPTAAGTYGVGIGFARYEALEKLSGQLAGVRPDLWPRASTVITLAQDWLRDNEALPAERAQPVYLRDNVAKKSQ